MPIVALTHDGEKMLVKFLGNSFSPGLQTVGFTADTQLNLTKEEVYEVFGIAGWPEDNYYCVISDLEMPLWVPGSVLKVLDEHIQKEWKYTDVGSELKFLHGPPAFMNDENSYTSLVSLEPEAVEDFWAYVKEYETKFP